MVTGQHPEDTPWKIVFDGWHIDPAAKTEIDAILKRCIVNPVSPAFMAPPVTRPKEQEAA